MNFTEVRLRSRVPDADIEPMIGKILTDNEYDLLISGPTSITIPDGNGGTAQLLKFIPGAFAAAEMASFYDTLHELKDYETTNRGNASGTQRMARKLLQPDGTEADSTWTYSKPVASAIIGAFDAAPPKNYCRLTAWTGKETEKFTSLFPMFTKIGELFAQYVPDRFRAQMDRVRDTVEDWVIPGTPFSTITVNNTYPTGVHKDKGDLNEGFSTLATLRRGQYRGGRLVFPQWRVAVDMQDGDLLLMDAHQWHGNTQLEILDAECYLCSDPKPAAFRAGIMLHERERVRDLCAAHFAAVPPEVILYAHVLVPAERISVVSYYRTAMAACGTADEETQRAKDWAEHKISLGAVEEMAVESATA